MTAREFLNRPFILNNKINDKKIKLGYYRELSCSVSSPGFEEHYSSNRNIKAPFERYLEKIDALEEDPMEQMILRYRYIELKSMPEISVQMYYSLRWTKRLHRRALDSFERSHP